MPANPTAAENEEHLAALRQRRDSLSQWLKTYAAAPDRSDAYGSISSEAVELEVSELGRRIRAIEQLGHAEPTSYLSPEKGRDAE
jgi:hypothetical protein